jgi:hypothetical protein
MKISSVINKFGIIEKGEEKINSMRVGRRTLSLLLSLSCHAAGCDGLDTYVLAAIP